MHAISLYITNKDPAEFEEILAVTLYLNSKKFFCKNYSTFCQFACKLDKPT